MVRLYYHLGFLGSVLTKAKILLQQLWQKLDWDDVLLDPTAEEWKEFAMTFKCIENVRINQFILTDAWFRIVPQGFSDTSEVAYGIIVHLHCFYQNNYAKLCACVLLSQLIQKIRSCIKLEISDVVLHTDSTISLAWAIHIEIVSDLTSEAFIAALRRFFGRQSAQNCTLTNG
ncbi:integrase catalytic domain-containing protein [Trichonephila clavipes]|nr:integrase catalytic domain-containing protein [Trichonephila clavipes]